MTPPFIPDGGILMPLLSSWVNIPLYPYQTGTLESPSAQTGYYARRRESVRLEARTI
ncbi:MAG: hypothetical protein WAN11_02340 [Syntrophobacteraceae bacterium]